MKDENKKGFEAINKFLFYSWNYRFVTAKAKDIYGQVNNIEIPEFIAKVHWTFGINHAVDKWRNATQAVNPEAYLPKFYQELDDINREALVEWILENYKG